MAKPKPKNRVAGRWLIESMTEWDRDDIDEEVRGYFEFDAKDSGDFHLAYVQGQLDYRLGERNGKPAVEVSWDGHDEMDPVQGQGWLVLDGDKLKGMFCFDDGDDSGIVLKRTKETAKKRPESTITARGIDRMPKNPINRLSASKPPSPTQPSGWQAGLDRDWRPGLAGFRGRALNESGLIYEKDGCSRPSRKQWRLSKRAWGNGFRRTADGPENREEAGKEADRGNG